MLVTKSLQERIAKAVKIFWRTRSGQQRKQGAGRRSRDRGQRSAVTGGAQLDGFIQLVNDLLVENGVPDTTVHRAKRDAYLPGFFRPTKQWDLVVVFKTHLLATIEFKSHVGPSFGNNYNNRTEEALGSATDLWAAYREGAFQPSTRPWLGYLMLLEEAPQSTSPVAVNEPHFRVFDEFRGASYARRYELFCEKLVRERLYDAACFMLSDPDTGRRGQYREPSAELSFENFVGSLMGHASGFVRLNK